VTMRIRFLPIEFSMCSVVAAYRLTTPTLRKLLLLPLTGSEAFTDLPSLSNFVSRWALRPKLLPNFSLGNPRVFFRGLCGNCDYSNPLTTKGRASHSWAATMPFILEMKS